MNEYIAKLYDFISSKDSGFAANVKVSDFSKTMSENEDYAKKVYAHISRISPGFEENVDINDYLEAVKKKDATASAEELQTSTEQVFDPISGELLGEVEVKPKEETPFTTLDGLNDIKRLSDDVNLQQAARAGAISYDELRAAGVEVDDESIVPTTIPTTGKKPVDPGKAKQMVANLRTRTQEEIDYEISTFKLDQKNPYVESADPFINDLFRREDLIKMGINPDDFSGFLKDSGYKSLYEKRVEDGIYDSGTYARDESLTLEMDKSRMIEAYIVDRMGRDVQLQKKLIQKDQGVNQDFTDNEYMPRVDIDLQEYERFREINFATLEAKKRELKEKASKKYQGRLSGEGSSFDFISDFSSSAMKGINSRIDDFSASTYDVLGMDSIAEEIRAEKEQTEIKSFYDINYSIVSGKKANVNGRNYIVSDNGQIYDTDIESRVTDFLDAKQQQEIRSKAQGFGRSKSKSGLWIEGAGVATDLAVQIAVHIATRRGIGFAGKLAGMTKAGRYVVSGANSIGLSREISSAMISQGMLGMSSGYEQTLKAAREAGISEDEALELASDAAKEMAAIYAATSLINPRIKIVKALTGEADIVRRAVNSYVKLGKKGFIKVFAQELVDVVKTIGIEGAKELVQENVQQAGEVFVVNDRVNANAGRNIVRDTITVDEFYTTAILSFAAGGLAGGAGSIAGIFKSKGSVSDLKAISILSQDYEKTKSLLNSYAEMGVIDRDKADRILMDIEAYSNAQTMMPGNLTEQQILEITPSISRIVNAQNQKKDLDPAFHEDLDLVIEQERKKIKDALQKKTTEGVETTEVTSQQINLDPQSILETEDTFTHQTSSEEAIRTWANSGQIVGRNETLADFDETVPKTLTEKATKKGFNRQSPNFQRGGFYGGIKEGIKFIVTAKGDNNFIPSQQFMNVDSFESSGGIATLRPDARGLDNFELYKVNEDGTLTKQDWADYRTETKSKTVETVGDIINRPVTLTSLGGSQLDTPIQGDLYVDGQQVVVEDANGNITEIGNFADIADTSVADLGIEYQTAQVTANPDGTLTIDNKSYTIQDDLPTGGLVFDEDGNVTEASVKDATGKPVMFKGSLAEDIAYQILLSRAESPEQRQNITEKLDKDEEFQNILREAQEPTEETADTDTKQVARGNRLFNEPLQDATTISDRFTKRKGIDQPTTEVPKVLDKEKSTRIAKAFEKLKSNPNDPKVKKAYNALAEETVEQYQELIDAGYVIEINNEEPYANSAEMIEDFRKNKRIKIFSTESGFGSNKITDKQRQENPMLRDSGFKDTNGKPLLINDLFRAVHDFFGHAKEGNSFGPKGEEIAWSIHSRMFSTEARRAMTTETRGQSSWVNFSGVNQAAFAKRDEARALRNQAESENNVDRKRALLEEAKRKVDEAYNEMKFAEQKIALLPDEFVFEGDDVVDQIDRLINAERSIGRMKPMSQLNSKEVRQKILDNIELVKKSLLSIVPDIKITPLGQERYFEYTGSDSTQGLYYYTDPKEIVINIDTASPLTVFHEAIHAVLYSLTDVNNKFYDETIDRATEKMVESLKKFVDKKTLKKLNNHTKLYFDERKGHEFVAELGSILAEGYESFSTKAKRIIKTWLDTIAKKLGITKGLTDSDIYNSLRALSIAISRGEDLSTYDKSFIEGLVKEEYKKNYLEDFFTSKTSYFTLTAGKTAEEGLIKKGFTQEEASKVVEEYFKRNPVQLEGYKSFRRMFEASKLSPQNGVNTAKENGFSDADIRKWGNSKGFTTAEINDAIKAYEEEKRFKGMQEEGLFNPDNNRIVQFFDKARKYLFSAKSFLGKSGQIAMEDMFANMEVEASKAVQVSRNLKKLLKESNLDIEKVADSLDKFLRGDSSVELPPKIKKLALIMRTHIDSLSKQLVEVGIAKTGTESHFAIMSNIGSYMYRSYEVFDNPDYKPSEIVLNAAKNYLRNAMRSKAYEIAMKENNDPVTVLEEIVDKEVDKILNKNLENQYVNAANNVAAKKTRVMDRRLDIPFEIRALMGEYSDPVVNYAKSVRNISELIEKHKFAVKLKNAGEGLFLFNESTGIYNVQIASENSRSLDPLNGMFTSKEIYNQLQNRPPVDFSGWPWIDSIYKGWLKGVGLVKANKTIQSIATHSKNILSNGFFMAANGYTDSKEYKNAWKVLKNDLLKRSDDELNDKLNEYKKAGIISQGVQIQELRSMLGADDDFELALLQRNVGRKLTLENLKGMNFGEAGIEVAKQAAKKGRKGLRKVYTEMGYIYQAEDDFFKIVAYESERKRYAKAFHNNEYESLSDAQKQDVDDYSREIVKNVLPNYSRTGGLAKALKALPLSATFISFEMEAWRTAYNTVKLAADEIKDPKTREIGKRRMKGIMSIMMAKGLIYSSLGLVGGTDDDDEEETTGKKVVDAVRNFVYPWVKNANLLVYGVGDGKFTFVNLSGIDPHGSLDKALISMMRSETVVDAFINAIKQVAKPFVDKDIAFEAFTELITNEDSVTGKPIFLETDTIDEMIGKALGKLYKAAEPGTFTSFGRIASKEGVKNKALEAVGQFTGIKPVEITVKDQMFFRSRDIYNSWLLNTADFRRAKRSLEKGEMNEQEYLATYERANQNHKEIYQNLVKLYQDAVVASGKPEDLIASMKSSRIPRYVIDGVIQGVVPDLQ